MSKKTICIVCVMLFIFLTAVSVFAKRVRSETEQSTSTRAQQYWELGNKAFENADYNKALELYFQALNLYGNKASEEVGGLYDEIGQTYCQLGDYNNALKYLNQSLSITRKLNKPEHLAAVLSHLGITYTEMGLFREAEQSLLESLDIRKKLGDEYDIGETYNNLGLMYWRKLDFGRALDNYEKSLSILRKNNFEKEMGYVLDNIAMVYVDIGEYKKAEKYSLEAKAVIDRLGNPYDKSIRNLNLGGIYDMQGKIALAVKHYTTAYEIAKKSDLKEIMGLALNNIAGIYQNAKEYEKALNYYNKAYRLFKEMDNQVYINMVLSNMGYIYLEQKKFSAAEKKFTEALKYGDKLFFSPDMAEYYIAKKDYRAALKNMEKAPLSEATSPLYRVQLFTLLGIAYKNMGEYDKAVYYLKNAVSLSEDLRIKAGKGESFFQRGIYKGIIRPYKYLVATLAENAIGDVRLKRNRFDKYTLSSAFYFSELTKARTLIEAISQKNVKPVDISIDLKRREDDLLLQLTILENKWEDALKKGEKAITDLQKRREGIKKELDSLINELRQKYPRYAALNYPAPVKAEELPLKSDEVLLEYTVTDDATYLFVVRKGGVKRVIEIPLGKEELEENIKSFIEPMNLKEIDKFSVSKAKKLYDVLLSEASKDIGEFDKVIIVPDGILGLLPFEALVVTDGGTIKDSIYVADKYSITYYQSATILLLNRMLHNKEAEKTLFAIANPVYNSDDPRYLAWKKGETVSMPPSGNYSFRGLAINAKWGAVTEEDTNNRLEFPPLLETEIEVKEIARIMGVNPEPPDILLGVLANETNLKLSSLENYKYIHFATHTSLPGMIQGINEPFILLGQVENKEDDGFLTLSEVAGMKLNGDMVVLSACVTGVGKEVEGEGVVNFARGFQQAGARSVLVSLWEVASEPAVEYMKILYSHLKSGKTKSEALMLTRTKMKEKYRNPFYWAVFILHGEGGM